jgi:hypothetical protein
MEYPVVFVRVKAQPATDVTRILQALYDDGWRVVSHADSDGEYSFVLEKRDEL